MAYVPEPSFDTDTMEKPPRLAKFLLGTVAPVHLTALEECFLSLTELREPTSYTDATGSIVLATAKGDAMIPVFFDNTITWLKLKNVHYAPYSDRKKSLISVSGLHAAGISVEWKTNTDTCSLLDDSLNVVVRGSSRGCEWYLDVDLDLIRYNTPDIQKPRSSSSTPNTPDMVHPGSISAQSFNMLHTLEELNAEDGSSVGAGVDNDSSSAPEHSTGHAGPGPLSLVYSDFYGPLPVSVGGNRYAATFVDDYSRFSRIYFLKSPANYLAAVKSFVHRVENSSNSGHKLQTLHSGGEEGSHISAYLSARGIAHQTTLQRPSIARQFNHTLFTRVQSMLFESEVDHGWWEDTAAMAVYMFNRSPNPHLDFSLPVDVWSQSQKGSGSPTSFVYRAFGSRCTAILTETKGAKEIRKELECRVLRFDAGAGEWIVLTLEGDKMFGTKDVVFEDSED